ncbi:glycine zipper 2TM protein [Shimia isoporae]|uniref:17 kDa surface antigen n=1 Tax=Shimia isoporae TaxID=647720 RepID=A0A4R1NBK8_9RHOB|nr:glycine zipper 2TM domain-containing protein [Shimia isoporae]TCL01499.1 glycine zipper 2TM protein [Shimia isoporae]
MKFAAIPALLAAIAVVPACATTSERSVECAGATVTGAVVGGLIGNQLGNGQGTDILTAGGAVAGGALANKAAGCS